LIRLQGGKVKEVEVGSYFSRRKFSKGSIINLLLSRIDDFGLLWLERREIHYKIRQESQPGKRVFYR